MTLLGWAVGAALLDEWDHREEEECEKEELRQKNWENERRIRNLESRLGQIEGVAEVVGTKVALNEVCQISAMRIPCLV